MAILVSKDAGRHHLMWSKEVAELVLVHGLGQVRDVEIGVLLIGEGLQFGIE